jgi:integrase
LAPDTISGMVSEWMRAAGVKSWARDGVSAHALRHTCASDVLEHSKDLRAVQDMLGHRHLQTTSVYLRRANLDRLREAMGGRRYLVA